MTTEADILRVLDENEIDFVDGQMMGRISCMGGAMDALVTPETLNLYIEDRDKFAAQYMGVSLEEYTGWINSNGSPRCGEITSKGTRCRNMVSGGIQRNLKAWIELDGGICAVHGGESSPSAR